MFVQILICTFDIPSLKTPPSLRRRNHHHDLDRMTRVAFEASSFLVHEEAQIRQQSGSRCTRSMPLGA